MAVKKTSSIEMLINAKKQAKDDDLILFMDEVIAYEKLSRAKAFQDLKTSKAAQKKLPLLSGACEGNMYNLAMLQMVGNIITHLTGEFPPIVAEILDRDMSKRELRRMEIMEDAIVKVFYYALNGYCHETMEKNIVAIFTEEQEKQIAILIVVRNNDVYEIYQGYYKEKEEEKEVKATLEPIVVAGEGYSFSMKSYSVMGNNAYPFAVFEDTSGRYSVMFPKYNKLWLTKETDRNEKLSIKLTTEQINRIGLLKTDGHKFAEYLALIIRKGKEK